MKYPYAVKANGKWYRPNEEVPDGTISKMETVDESANQRGIPLIEEVQAEKAVEDAPKKRGRKQ